MSLEELKFSESEFAGRDIASLDDRPKMAASELKAMFDNVGKNMLALGRFNTLIDELLAGGVAKEMTVTLPGGEPEALADVLERIFSEAAAHNTDGTAHTDIRASITTVADGLKVLAAKLAEEYYTREGVAAELAAHNTDGAAHTDIRVDITTVADGLKALAAKLAEEYYTREEVDEALNEVVKRTLLVLVTEELPAGEFGTAYSAFVVASGGVLDVGAGYEFALADGELPPGLALEEWGQIRGTPSAAGEWMANVSVTDSAGGRKMRWLALVVAARPVKFAVQRRNYLYDGTAKGPKLAAGEEVSEGTEWLVRLLGADGEVLADLPSAAGEYAIEIEWLSKNYTTANADELGYFRILPEEAGGNACRVLAGLTYGEMAQARWEELLAAADVAKKGE